MGKAEAQQQHAIRRYRERYGFTLDDDQYAELCERARTSERIEIKQSDRVSIRRVSDVCMDRDVVVVWDKKRGKIVTFLNQDYRETYDAVMSANSDPVIGDVLPWKHLTL